MSDEQNPARPDNDHTVSVLTRTRTLCGQCSADVGIDGVAVAVFASDTSRDLVYATDSTAERIDELEFTLGEGPGLTAYRSSVPEILVDMADPAATTRWPMFVPEIVDLGVRAVFAFPLRLFQGARIGVLELYRTRPGRLDAPLYRAAAGYAAVLGPIVVEELDPARNSTVVDPALFSRGKVHVASGMMAVQLRVSPADALTRLRAMAFAQHRRIMVIAQDIIAGRLRFLPRGVRRHLICADGIAVRERPLPSFDRMEPVKSRSARPVPVHIRWCEGGSFTTEDVGNDTRTDPSERRVPARPARGLLNGVGRPRA